MGCGRAGAADALVGVSGVLGRRGWWWVSGGGWQCSQSCQDGGEEVLSWLES